MDVMFSTINESIKKEADQILYEQQLLSILSDYGKPYVTGSYAMDLMTWRDLDIYLQTDTIQEEEFFSLGARINHQFKPVKMSYRNERIGRTPGLPAGLYWGIYFGNERKGAWKIDIWAIGEKECSERVQFCEKLSDRITGENRHAIMEIKSSCWTDPSYRKSYTSKDIYEAVLENGIRNVESFKKYMHRL
jgi:hypothetical protein